MTALWADALTANPTAANSTAANPTAANPTAANQSTPEPGRRPLVGDESAEVVIVGAGYTGLWTAYYLLVAQPGLDVLVLEAEHVGFGASGRNGGWCSALLPQSTDAIARSHGRAAAVAIRRAMQATVDEVGAIAEREGIACDWAKSGTVVVARNPAQLGRAKLEVDRDRAWAGLDGWQLLDQAAAAERIGVTRMLGASYTPHCARLHPGKLVSGLARAVERRGGRISEGTRVQRIDPAVVTTTHGRVLARQIIRATEAWTSQLPGARRQVAPVYSLVISTEPLSGDFWQEAGLAQGETFSEHRHVIVYGQRTADDRLVFGGRGAPYHFGSRIRPEFDAEPRVFAALRTALVDLFPQAAAAQISHQWGGPLGIARDWHASVQYDAASGLGAAGGYVGDGVASSNLAGRTLAELILGRTSELTQLSWVNHRNRRWEPEPLRWLGINVGLKLATAADALEAKLGRGTPLTPVLARLTGH